MSIMTSDPASSPDPSPAGAEPRPPSASPPARPKRSIVAKQALFVGFLVALTGGTLTTAGYRYVGEIVAQQIDARLSAIADDRQALLLTALRREEERVEQVAGRVRLRNLLDARGRPEADDAATDVQLQAALDDFLENVRDFRAIRLEGPDGEALATSGPPEDVAAIPVGLREPNTGKPPRAAIPVKIDGGRVAVFTADVRGRAGAILGRIAVLVDLGRVVEALADSQWLGETGDVLIGMREGAATRLLFPPRRHPAEAEVSTSRGRPMDEAIAGRGGLMRTTDRDGRAVLAAYRPLNYADWGVVVRIDADEAYAPVRRLRRLLAALGGTILALGLAASYVLARQHTRPIRRLADVAEAVADGRLDTPIAVTSNDEIGVLESSFARMTEQLARSHGDLEARIHERTRDLEAVRDLLDAFFRISTSRLDSGTLDRTFDSVLEFCSRLGYELAMLSLVDREAGVIRGVRGAGTMGHIVADTVRSLDGPDVLARVAREARVEIIPDSTVDPTCDHEAVARAGFRGQIVLPLAGGDEVLGTLQVAVREVLDPSQVDLRPLETLASHAGRTLAWYNQIREVRRLNESLDHRAVELAKSESALRERTDVLRSVLDCMGEGVVVVDLDARLLVINPAARELLGREESGVGSSVWRADEPVYDVNGDRPYRSEDLPLARAIRGESPEPCELMLGHPSLQHGRCLFISARPLVEDGGAIRGGLVVFHDVTARKCAEIRLAVQYAAARVLAESDSLAEAAPRILKALGEPLDWDLGVLWRVDATADQVRCLSLWRNPATPAPEGLDEAVRAKTFGPGESLAGRVWADRKALWLTDLDRLDGESCELCHRLVAAGLRSAFGAPVMLRGECIGVLGFFSRFDRREEPELLDLAAILGAQIGQFNDRCQMHARVVQSEKLASLGMLSASVAHEINNPLAYVSSNLVVLDRDVRTVLDVLACYEPCLESIAAARPDLAEEIRRLDEEYDMGYIKANLGKILDSTRQGAKRVADIVHNLRGFARADRDACSAVDLRESISAALEMIRGRLERRGVEVIVRAEDVPAVVASPTQLNQVFLNLLVNAMQAIDAAQREHGRITVEAKVRGDQVCVEIRDNGCGMPPDVRAQIFDPFFTTKSAGEGTGLGLSITHGIVLDHGGRIEVESVPGEGACFRVVLPVSRKPAG
ncbi:ATP-binding protein [Planctomyces sp. SH-PL62]|uniref:ATP-binding protein n=1 Tax=Planctomyces sp. SH-PL62 TaxID=1636152 RepID=UPI00078E6E4C|nr:ATP-binding protein [Planctomyces sp. SH-PL62]AMV37986.1 Sensor protein ZraS [Planctomyces sp. SH-PL62]